MHEGDVKLMIEYLNRRLCRCGYSYIYMGGDISVVCLSLQGMHFICSMWRIAEGISAAISGTLSCLCGLFRNYWFFFYFFFLNFTALAALSGGKSCNGLVYCFLSFHPCSSCNVGLMFLVSWNTKIIYSHLQPSLMLDSFPLALNFRCCQAVPGSKWSWDIWSPELNILVTQALFIFITWHLLLKGRTKGKYKDLMGNAQREEPLGQIS